jgi:hypothetical protein
MRSTHRYDTKAYHDYYIHQAGKGYPVFAGRRYQRGHGLGSIFGGLFKAAMPLLKKVQVPFLSEMSFKVFRCLVCRRLVFLRLAGPFRARCPGGPTVSIAFWSKFSPVDFNRDLAACLIFIPRRRNYHPSV